MADNNQAIEWYLARDGRQHGPVSDVELKKIIELGFLRPSDLVWRQGMAEWATAESVLEMATAGAPAKPAPSARSVDTAPRPAGPEAAKSAAAPRPAQAAHARLEPEHVGSRQHDRSNRLPEPERPDQRGREPSRAQGRPQGGQDASPRVDPRGAAGATLAAAPHSGSVHAHHTAVLGGPQADRAVAVRVGGQQPATDQEHGRKRGFPWRLAIILILVAGFAGGGLALHRAGKLANLPFLAAPSVSDAVPVVSRPNGPARDDSAQQPQQPAVAAVAPSGSAQDVDAGLQKSPLWQRLRRDFPDWYQERVAELSQMSSESKSEREIHTAMIRWLIELRRRHNADALAASPDRLKSIAASFVESLSFLARESTAACYGYISQGEASPLVADLRRPEQRATLDVQLATIFDAVAEGRKSPMKREPPRREDYDMLSVELGKRGWSAADLQLFTDARALSRAAPEKVCQMVQDWFAAQLAVGDDAARTRLLGEALKPVVAG